MTRSPAPRRPLTARRPLALVAAATLLAGLAGCAPAPTSAPGAQDPSAGTSFPLTITNCGSPVTLAAPPQRIVLVNADEIPNLEALGAVDRVVAMTGSLQPDLYAPATYDTLAKADVLSTETNATGGSVVSQESLIGMRPDLVIAPEKAVDRAALAASGIPLYTPSAYCADPAPELRTTATFDRVWDELRSLGAVLGAGDRAEQAITTAQAGLADPAPDAGTAAALYVSSGGSVLSPYGGPSMVTPVFQAAGLRNVYADSDQRVFDANVEDIVARDPRTVVLLYSSGSPDDAIAAFRGAPGVSGLSAVRDGRVVALRFPFTDPPSMLSAKGPAELAGLLAALP
ncbi:ABC transporter substrate-binding protein [Clavibacter sp. CFBP 8614]|uniref:ABC transporter substrate-binding protein n=1 Tax=unclassified Clavibacter TaxID=2626594 RepID=UPI00404279F3